MEIKSDGKCDFSVIFAESTASISELKKKSDGDGRGWCR